jgi:hypothetical protein
MTRDSAALAKASTIVAHFFMQTLLIGEFWLAVDVEATAPQQPLGGQWTPLHTSFLRVSPIPNQNHQNDDAQRKRGPRALLHRRAKPAPAAYLSSRHTDPGGCRPGAVDAVYQTHTLICMERAGAAVPPPRHKDQPGEMRNQI